MARNKPNITEAVADETTVSEEVVSEEVEAVADETNDEQVAEKEETAEPSDNVDEKPKVYEIKSPNESFRGVCASVSFLNGVGHTSNEHLVEWFKKHGFEVTEKE